MDITIKKNDRGTYNFVMNRAYFNLTLKSLLKIHEEINKVIDEAAIEMPYEEFNKAFNQD